MFLVSLLLTSSYVVEHSYLELECIGVQINLEAFVRSTGKAVSFHIISISTIASNALELLFFVILIFELFKHQRMHDIICSSSNSNATRVQVRRNAVTALGHFISWLVEGIVFGTCYFLLNSEIGLLLLGRNSWIFVLLLPSINYAVFPSAQVFTSPELRNYVFGPPYFRALNFPTISCECQTCISNEEGAVQGMEMINVQQNGYAHHI